MTNSTVTEPPKHGRWRKIACLDRKCRVLSDGRIEYESKPELDRENLTKIKDRICKMIQP